MGGDVQMAVTAHCRDAVSQVRQFRHMRSVMTQHMSHVRHFVHTPMVGMNHGSTTFLCHLQDWDLRYASHSVPSRA